jgi:hypothetical protein
LLPLRHELLGVVPAFCRPNSRDRVTDRLPRNDEPTGKAEAGKPHNCDRLPQITLVRIEKFTFQ